MKKIGNLIIAAMILCLAGREYWLLYPLAEAAENGRTTYVFGLSGYLPRVLLVVDMILPARTYWLEYEVVDRFQRSFRMEKMELHWDRQAVTLPEGSVWEGTVCPEWY